MGKTRKYILIHNILKGLKTSQKIGSKQFSGHENSPLNCEKNVEDNKIGFHF